MLPLRQVLRWPCRFLIYFLQFDAARRVCVCVCCVCVFVFVRCMCVMF